MKPCKLKLKTKQKTSVGNFGYHCIATPEEEYFNEKKIGIYRRLY
jgi:hypothetical protein